MDSPRGSSHVKSKMFKNFWRILGPGQFIVDKGCESMDAGESGGI